MRLAVFLSTLAVLLPGGWALTVTSTTRSWRSLSPGGSTHLPRHVSTSGAKLALLVAGEEGLFMSGDSGESWIPRNGRFPGRDAQQAKINPADSNHWVVTTSHGFYQSFNAGASWAVVSVAGTAPTSVIAFSADGNAIYVGTGSWTGVRSHRITNPTVYTDTFGPSWALRGSPRIFRSTNKGASWIMTVISDVSTTMVNGIVVSPLTVSVVNGVTVPTQYKVWATIGFNVSDAALQQGMSWAAQTRPGHSRKLVYSTNSGASWSNVDAFPSFGLGAGFGVSISQDGTRLAVAAATRVNGTSNPIPYNSSLVWNDRIYVGTIQSSGVINELYSAESSLPSGGRYYRYLELDASSTSGAIIRASAANIIGFNYGQKEGMHTGSLATCVWDNCAISWYGVGNGNTTSEQYAGWEENDNWQTYSGASNSFGATGAAQQVYATSSHGLYKAALSSTQVSGASYGEPWEERYSQSWDKKSGFTSRGWDALELTWVAVHPANENHMFAGAREQLGYESWDGGLTWNNIARQAMNDTYNLGYDCSNPSALAPGMALDGAPVCYNHTGLLDRSLAGDFVGNKVPLLLFGGTRVDLNHTEPTNTDRNIFALYAQYWNGTFEIVAGGHDRINYAALDIGNNGVDDYTMQNFEATSITADRVFTDIAVVGFNNGMVWMVHGCNGASSGNAPSRLDIKMLFGWSLSFAQTKCESVTSIAFHDNATGIFIQCKSHLYHAYYYPVGGIPADGFASSVVDLNRYLVRELYDTDLSSGAIGGYMARSVAGSALNTGSYSPITLTGFAEGTYDTAYTYMIDEYGLSRMTDLWGSTAQYQLVVEPPRVTVVSHETADGVVSSCVGGVCPTVPGNISNFAILDFNTIVIAVRGGSASTSVGRGVFLVHFSGDYNTPASYTVISGAISNADVRQFIVGTSALYAVTEGRGLWSYAYNWISDGDIEQASGWTTSGTVSMSSADDAAHGLVSIKLSGAGTLAETSNSIVAPVFPEPLNVHLSVKYAGGSGLAIFKFFDSNNLPVSHREYNIGADTTADWHSLFWTIYLPVRAATLKLQFNCSETAGSSLSVDHIWIGPSTVDTAGPPINTATSFTEYMLPLKPGVPAVTSLGGLSVNTAFITITWTPPSTAFSGPVWYYQIWKKATRSLTAAPGAFTADSAYSLVAISYTTTLTVANLYRGTEMLLQVYAVNKVGIGAASEALQLVTLNTVPNPPVNLMIALPSTASTITIKWDEPADTGGQPIISYKVWLWSSDTSTWDGGTRYQGDGTQVKYLRLKRATSFKFKMLATNSVGDSVISAESALILTTDLYEPTVVLRFMLQFDIVLNDTLSIDAFNQTLADDLAYVIPDCTSDRFYVEMVNASEIFRMLVTTQSVKADIVYLSTPTSTNESMDTEIATLKAEVIQMGSNLHTQGIVSRNLDYGYWSVDWNGLYEGQAAVVYEWELGMFEHKKGSLTGMTSIIAGLIIFVLVPGLILKWLPFYRRLADQGMSNAEILTATIRLWYSYVLRCLKVAKRRWDKSCQPFFAKHFKVCRKQQLNPDGSVMDPAKALLLQATQGNLSGNKTEANETAQVMKVH